MVVFLYVTGETMIGTKILKRVGVSLFQGTKKLKMAWLKESLRDYRENIFKDTSEKLDCTRRRFLRFLDTLTAKGPNQ